MEHRQKLHTNGKISLHWKQFSFTLEFRLIFFSDFATKRKSPSAKTYVFNKWKNFFSLRGDHFQCIALMTFFSCSFPALSSHFYVPQRNVPLATCHAIKIVFAPESSGIVGNPFIFEPRYGLYSGDPSVLECSEVN